MCPAANRSRAHTEYWTISVAVSEAKSSLFSQQVRDELYLSPNVKLSGMNKMAQIESKELATDFLCGCSPVLERRYRSGYVATLKKWGIRI